MTDRYDDFDDRDEFDDERDDVREPVRRRRRRREAEGPRGPRRGMKRSVMHVITQIPAYLRLLVGLISDRRVSRVDRLLVIAAIAYIVSPFDLVPDLVPFLGQVDDVFLLMTALQRMVERAGGRVLRDHWRGDPRELDALNVAGAAAAAGFLLPPRVQRRLRRMAGQR